MDVRGFLVFGRMHWNFSTPNSSNRSSLLTTGKIA
jgi:hypothetical protein